jgi:hypothetical protein
LMLHLLFRYLVNVQVHDFLRTYAAWTGSINFVRTLGQIQISRLYSLIILALLQMEHVHHLCLYHWQLFQRLVPHTHHSWAILYVSINNLLLMSDLSMLCTYIQYVHPCSRFSLLLLVHL